MMMMLLPKPNEMALIMADDKEDEGVVVVCTGRRFHLRLRNIAIATNIQLFSSYFSSTVNFYLGVCTIFSL